MLAQAGQVLEATAVAVALLVVPGAAMGAALRLRGTVLWGAAPALTLGMTGAAAIGYARFGVPWTPWAFLIGAAAACAVAWACTALARRAGVALARRAGSAVRDRAGRPGPIAADAGASGAPAGWGRRGTACVLAAIVAAIAVHTSVIAYASRGYGTVPQGWDSLLHGEVIRWIAVHGDASPFSLAGAAAPADPHYYYPDAFHALAALGLQSGGTMPAAYTALVAATGAAFVVGSVAVVRRCDARPAAAAVGAFAAVAVGTFLPLMANWGPLSPFAMSSALIPGAAALLLAILRRPSAGAAVALGLAFSGMYVTHPTGALSGALVLALIAVAWLWRRARGGRRGAGDSGAAGSGADGSGAAGSGAVGPGAAGLRAGGAALVLAAATAAAVTWPSIDVASAGAMEAFDWPATQTVAGAIGNALTFPLGGQRQWALTVLLAAGCAAAVRRSAVRPFVAAFALFAALYTVTESSDAPWVQTLTALWWNDGMRFLALAGVVAVPVVAAGVMLFADGVRAAWAALAARRRGRHRQVCAGLPGLRRTSAPAAAIGLLAVGCAVVWAPRFATELRTGMYADGPAVTSGELAAYRWLAEHYDGGTVMNDPFDGSPWLYTLERVPIVIPGALGAEPEASMGAARMALYSDLHSLGVSPVVEDAVRHFDVRWVLVGEGSVGGRETPPGFDDLASTPGLSVAYRNPAATIYRVSHTPSRLSS